MFWKSFDVGTRFSEVKQLHTFDLYILKTNPSDSSLENEVEKEQTQKPTIKSSTIALEDFTLYIKAFLLKKSFSFLAIFPQIRAWIVKQPTHVRENSSINNGENFAEHALHFLQRDCENHR